MCIRDRAHFLFATERLATLGEVVLDLSGLDVKLMQPRLNGMKRHAQTRASLAEDDLYATCLLYTSLPSAEKDAAASFSV